MTLLHHPGEAIALVNELASPVPPELRDKFLKLVKASLSADEFLIPAKVVQACAAAQRQLMFAPVIDEPPAMRPTRSQPAKGPFRRRA